MGAYIGMIFEKSTSTMLFNTTVMQLVVITKSQHEVLT